MVGMFRIQYQVIEMILYVGFWNFCRQIGILRNKIKTGHKPMKQTLAFKFLNFTILLYIVGFHNNSFAQIANNYSRDINIEKDPDVLFTEMGEESSLTLLFNNWDANSSSKSIALDQSTIPYFSPGSQSIRLFTTAGTLGQPGTIQSAFLNKLFRNVSIDTIYARWYVKYNTTGTFHHSGPRLGGNNPIVAYQPNTAGKLPTGSDFFYLGAETTEGKKSPVKKSTFDYYNYWMHQRGTSFFPGIFYGNSFVNDPNVFIDMNTWNCIEVRLILNNPVTSYNGEAAIWINGVKVSDVKTGTPGYWDEDNFIPDPNGTPFEGFQWRNDANLKFTYFQLLHYVDKDPPGHINSINFDHIVVAKKYIGPISINPTGETENLISPSISIFPNPANELIKVNTGNELLQNIKIYSITGTLLGEYLHNDISIAHLPCGLYFIAIETNQKTLTKKIIKQ